MKEPTSGARYAALAVSSRRRLLEVLQASHEPCDAALLAASIGLHITTARFHLEVLEQTGLVVRTTQHAGRPGRPRQLYAATGAVEATEGHHQLAEVLAAALADDPDGGSRRAENVGERWADQLLANETLSDEETFDRLTDLFTRLGFAPRPVSPERQHTLDLEDCPFRDIARAHPDVVCSIHLGLLRGTLRRSGLSSAQVQQAGLRPFIEPELCIADV